MSHPVTAYDEAQDHIGGKWTFFHSLLGSGEIKLDLPSFSHPLHFLNDMIGRDIFPKRFQITKFMLLELIVAVLLILMFRWVAKKAEGGDVPKGKCWNLLESLLDVVRDGIARPVLGDKEADRLMPFLWTGFFFVLFSNLLGMIPMMGSPTASIWMTGSLALCSFFMFHAVPMARLGFVGYIKTMWLPIEIAPVKWPSILYLWPAVFLGWAISAMIFVIELLGTVIKGVVLAVRLFGNIFAGHVSLATILLFAYNAGFNGWLNTGISVASVLGAAVMSLLELLVAFLQAYVFTFLTAMFIGIPLSHAHEHEHEHEHGHGEHGHGESHGHDHGHAAAHAH